MTAGATNTLFAPLTACSVVVGSMGASTLCLAFTMRAPSWLFIAGVSMAVSASQSGFSMV